jgi:hypothetical protein
MNSTIDLVELLSKAIEGEPLPRDLPDAIGRDIDALQSALRRHFNRDLRSRPRFVISSALRELGRGKDRLAECVTRLRAFESSRNTGSDA